MQKASRTVSYRLVALAVTVLCAALNAQGQSGTSRDARIVSAHAGGINFVAGSVSVRLRGETAWNQLTTEQNLESGDMVKTGFGGRVEVLLSPGSYLRVGGNAEFELSDASLDSLRIKLLKGSAVVEATGYGDMELSIAVNMPQAEVSIIRSGIYRFNVQTAGFGEVAVHKGRAVINRGATLLKGNQVARFSGGSEPEVSKLDKRSKDELDLWSKERASELASANQKLSSRTLSPILASLNFDSLWANTPSRFGRAGVWVFNRQRNCYTFLPFTAGWNSPYGSYYDSRYVGNFNCNSCRNNRNTTPPNHTSGASANIRPNPNTGSSPNPRPSPMMRENPRVRHSESPAREMARPPVREQQQQRTVSRSATRVREQ